MPGLWKRSEGQQMHGGCEERKYGIPWRGERPSAFTLKRHHKNVEMAEACRLLVVGLEDEVLKGS